jgi:hypothetical protein
MTLKSLVACDHLPLFHEIVRVRKLAFVEVHLPLSGTDVGVPRQPAGVLNPLLAADLHPALVAGQVKHQIPRQAGLITQAGVCPAQILDAPTFSGR